MKYPKLAAAMTALTMLLTVPCFAHADDTYRTFVLGKDNWQFQNHTFFFGKAYTMTEEHRSMLEENLSHTEIRMASNIIDGEWIGSCYGMAATSILACYDMIDYADYQVEDRETATSLFTLTEPLGHARIPSDKMKSLINYYFALQYTNAVRQDAAHFMTQTTEKERVQLLLNHMAKGKPTHLSFFGDMEIEGEVRRVGHAVVAFGAEYGEFEVSGRTFDVQISIYDSNYIPPSDQPHLTRYLYVNTEDLSWYIPVYELGSAEGSNLCQLISDVNLLNAGGFLGDTQYSISDDFIAILSTQEFASEETVQQIAFDGEKWTAIEDGTINIQVFPAFLGDSVTDGAYNYTLSDAESGYVLKTAETEEYDLAMNYEDRLLIADASAGSQAVFHPSGYLEISGKNTSYTLEMVWNEGYYTGSWYNFIVSGTADTASLQKTKDGYILKSDNLQNVTVTAQNDDAQANLTFSTDADSVLLQEVDETTIAAKIDTDGDGIYETEVKEERVYGDLNGDGSVNALDAALVLQYAAYAGAGGELSLEEYLLQMN